MTDKRPSERYLHLIGSITAYWSITEYICDQALATLLRIDPNHARRMNAATHGFNARLEVLSSLSGEVLEDERARAELQAILEALNGAYRSRDDVVHSIWFNLGYEDITRTKYRFKPDKTPIVRCSKYSLEKLQRILDDIKDATEDLTAFLVDRLGMPRSMPGVVIETLRD